MLGAILRWSLEIFIKIIMGIYVLQYIECLSSWLLKESSMCIFTKEGMRDEITFYEGKRG